MRGFISSASVFQTSAHKLCLMFSSPFWHYFEGLKFSPIIFFYALHLKLHTFYFLNGDFINVIVRCSVAKSCLTLCNPMDCNTPGFPVPNHLPEFAQVHVHWISDAIQPAHPLSPPSPPALNLPASESFPRSQLFVSGGSSIEAEVSASVIPKCFQGWFPLRLTGLISWLSKVLSKVFSSNTVQKHQFFGALPSLYL